LNMGDWIVFPARHLARTFALPVVLSMVIGGCLGAGGLLSASIPWTTWLILAGYGIYSLCFTANILPPNWRGHYVWAWKAMTEQNQMVSLNTCGPVSPPLIHLTDGGHLDNLGLIELLRRQCKLMICFDAGYDPQCTCEDLVFVLNSFRHKCTFNVEYPFEHDNTTKPILVSVEKAINKFAQDESCFSMCIRVQYIKTKKKASIWYVKLRKSKNKSDDPLSQDEKVCGCCGTFPYISTIYQFFDRKLFDGFYKAGKRDGHKLLKEMKAYDDHIHQQLSPLKHHMKHLGSTDDQKKTQEEVQ